MTEPNEFDADLTAMLSDAGPGAGESVDRLRRRVVSAIARRQRRRRIVMAVAGALGAAFALVSLFGSDGAAALAALELELAGIGGLGLILALLVAPVVILWDFASAP